jgi:hypothetical protein
MTVKVILLVLGDAPETEECYPSNFPFKICTEFDRNPAEIFSLKGLRLNYGKSVIMRL